LGQLGGFFLTRLACYNKTVEKTRVRRFVYKQQQSKNEELFVYKNKTSPPHKMLYCNFQTNFVSNGYLINLPKKLGWRLLINVIALYM